MFISNLLLFLIALSLLIFIHELGHFLFAKLFKVYCMEFSLGMGPAIISKKFKKDPETTYSLRCLPIGGYVAMAGETQDNEQEKDLNIPYERTINGIKAWKRAIVVVAGVVFNFIFALILIAVLIFGQGTDLNKITVQENSIIYNAGLRDGDRILSVSDNIITENGETIYSSCLDTCNIRRLTKFEKIINKNNPTKPEQNQSITIKYSRDNEVFTTTVTRSYDSASSGAEKFGIGAVVEVPGLFEGIRITFEEFGEIMVLMFQAIGSLFTKEGFSQVGGPVQVYTVSAQMASQGFFSYVWFLAIISINLGFFNLLPIPGLDGARFFISIGETVTNKKFNPKIESYINMAGILLLFGLMIVVTIKDVFMLF